MNIIDIAKAVNPNANFKDVGIRQGEKLHEEMITSSDSYNTFDLGKYFIILPTIQNYFNRVQWICFITMP